MTGRGAGLAGAEEACETCVMRESARPEWLALALTALAGCPFCVAADMRVRTPRGPIAAGELVVGDRVESVEVATGRAVEGVIVHVRRATRECVALRWRGGELVCTPDHPLYSPERGEYRPASDWVDGRARMLLARTGESVEPVAVESVERCAGVREVVDLSLAAEPRNFVAEGIVVHNKSIALDPPDTDRISEKGPPVGLSATEEPRRFRIRICDGESDTSDINTLRLTATSAVAVAPSGAEPMWLAMYHELDDEATTFDGRVPGTLDTFIDPFSLPEATCDVGFVVGFERVDDEPDGTIAVSWVVSLEFFTDSGGTDAPTLTIEEE